MPTYTVRKKDSEDQHEWDITCSYTELEQTCEEYGLERVLKPVGFITQQTGDTMKKAGTEWRDRLNTIKKNAGRRSTINT